MNTRSQKAICFKNQPQKLLFDSQKILKSDLSENKPDVLLDPWTHDRQSNPTERENREMKSVVSISKIILSQIDGNVWRTLHPIGKTMKQNAI